MSYYFQNLTVYQESLIFSKKIFTLTKHWSPEYRFSLTDQIHRAALSIPLNIAEGSGKSKKEFQKNLLIARGSAYECIPLLTIAKDLSLLQINSYNELIDTIDHIVKMITSLKNKIEHFD